MHAGDRNALLARYAVIEGDDSAAIHTPGHIVLGLTGRDTAVAFDATL
jgi:hypothetical protein